MKNTQSGIILIDILLALTLATIFVTVLAESTITARQLFANAKERDDLLKIYESHKDEFADLMPYQTFSTIDNDYFISAKAKWYGNDRIETDINIFDTSISSTTNNRNTNSAVSLISIRAYPFTDINDSIGTPICSADFSNMETVGSYSYLQRNGLTYNLASTSSVLTSSSTPIVSIVPIALPINPSLPLTDIEVRNGVAYISADSSTASDPDLLVVDINNTASPIVRSTINTGPGIVSIVLAGNHIFAAASSAAAQLHIIRLDNTDGLNGPNVLTLEKKYKLPPPYATATEPLGSSIFFNDDKIYLGTEKWDGDEFSIIDVSNPIMPIKIGGLEIGSKINDIFVRNYSNANEIEGVNGPVAYVATAAQGQLIEADVNNPSLPIIKNQFSPSGWQRQEGKAVSFFEDSLNLGRTSGGYDVTTDHEAFEWATSSLVSSPSSVNIPGGVYGMISDRAHSILATRQANKELQIFDRTLTASSSMAYSLPAAPQTITCDGNKLYVLAHTAPVIYEIRIMN